jgi:uncharacterized membrane protein
MLIAGFEHPALWEVFRPLCHQEAARSLSLDGHQMMICSRCAGIYLGVAVGVWSPFRISLGHFCVLLMIALAVMGAHVVLQNIWLGIHHPVRLTTGLILGSLLGALLSVAIRNIAETRAS